MESIQNRIKLLEKIKEKVDNVNPKKIKFISDRKYKIDIEDMSIILEEIFPIGGIRGVSYAIKIQKGGYAGKLDEELNDNEEELVEKLYSSVYNKFIIYSNMKIDEKQRKRIEKRKRETSINEINLNALEKIV